VREGFQEQHCLLGQIDGKTALIGWGDYGPMDMYSPCPGSLQKTRSGTTTVMGLGEDEETAWVLWVLWVGRWVGGGIARGRCRAGCCTFRCRMPMCLQPWEWHGNKYHSIRRQAYNKVPFASDCSSITPSSSLIHCLSLGLASRLLCPLPLSVAPVAPAEPVAPAHVLPSHPLSLSTHQSQCSVHLNGAFPPQVVHSCFKKCCTTMSRLRSSAAPFGQASYAPLRDSRHSLDSTPEDEIIDSDVIASHNQQDRRQHHSMHRLDNQESGQHILASDSDDDSDDDGILLQQKKMVMDNAASSTSQRESSGDGSTIVSVGSNPDSPPPKYNRESFEFAEPNPNRSQEHESDPEECLNSPRYDGSSQKGLGSQVTEPYLSQDIRFS